ncbi:hypothetical protein B9Z19DRAFT_1192157 [Tuber borchii]|uniref:C2H2-type domain-containing protein n=1 Tax=Tuber borchii TaxID=42251 RepID=A0A2T6ZX03_TUBBO|nr:hypothetical protein B9Z19DRAFT_1192157 [Tuber borchii]
MDHVKHRKTVDAAPVEPAIGEPSTPLALYEFSLISFDQSGCRQPLPPGLGNLPLYLDHDGYFSVNGSLDLTVFSLHTTLARVSYYNESTFCFLVTDISSFSVENPHVTPNPNSDHLDTNTISRTQARFERRSYHCSEPGGTWGSAFPTKQALDRHHEVKHLNLRVDCPIPGCEQVGDKGIKRKDNLPAHIWNKHKIRLSRQPHGN